MVVKSVDGDNTMDLLKGLNEYFIPFHCGVMSVTVSEFPITGVVGFEFVFKFWELMFIVSFDVGD